MYNLTQKGPSRIKDIFLYEILSRKWGEKVSKMLIDLIRFRASSSDPGCNEQLKKMQLDVEVSPPANDL